MKNKKMMGRIAFALVFTLLITACFGQSGGDDKVIKSAEALKVYLDSLPTNSPDNPIKVTMNVSDQMLPGIVAVLKNTNKYVSLNLSGKALTTIPSAAFHGCKTLVSITIPSLPRTPIETNVTADWDSKNESGTVRYFDLNMGKTLKEEVNKKTGVTEKIVIKSFTESTQPRLVVFDDNDEHLVSFNLTNDAVLFVNNGQRVNKGDTLAKLISMPGIGNFAFEDCTSLASITIPNSGNIATKHSCGQV